MADMAGNEEKFEFQTEAAELLRMMINSVYSNRDIFLRELISNASDAIDKRRIERLTNSELADFEPKIKITRDEGAHMLTVSDNGIGMTRDELIEYLGTIAKSGTREFLDAVHNAKDKGATTDQLIGQFGVGFYSVFMVADHVEVVSRKLGTSEAYSFKSKGDGAFTISPAERSECGTTVTLWLKNSDVNANPDDEGQEAKDYSDEWTIRDIVRQYSDFIAWPIVMTVSRKKEGEDTLVEETLNSQKAIWAKAEGEVKPEEYHEFYRHLTHDWHDPLAHFRLNVEGATSFKGLFFIPSQAPFDVVMNPKSGGICLYINRVFIMKDCAALIPEYMRFVRGVVDSDDLPLNISREILQEDPLVGIIRRSTQRKVLAELKKMLENDRETYEKFWKVFGRILKEGIIQDRPNAKAILELCLFRTTANDGWTTIAEVKSRKKPDQEQNDIYCLTGGNAEMLAASPKVEPFVKRGHEVLLMTDSVDEVILADQSTSASLGDVKLLNIDLENVTPETADEKKAAEEKLKNIEADFAPLKEQAMSSMSDRLTDVKPSFALEDAPSCLRSAGTGLTFQMEQMLRAMGQEVPQQKRILELNVEHPLIKKLMTMARDKAPDTNDLLALLYDQSLILEGAPLTNPSAFVKRMNEIMTRALGA